VPTYSSLAHFVRDWRKLDSRQRELFLFAVSQLVADLKSSPTPRRSLRVKKMQGHDDVWEMTWAPDGRATFHYGPAAKEGEIHVTWRRIGGHEIFNRP
jgi:hypothetical protein